MMEIGIQTYSLSKYIAEVGIERALEEVAKCGYDCIEPVYCDYGVGFKRVAEIMRECGLKAHSAHLPAEVLLSFDKAARFKELFGINTAVIPAISAETFYDGAKMSDFVLNALEVAQKLTLTLAYHNHDFEFRTGDALSSLPKRFPGLKLQPDVFWLKEARLDPLKFLTENRENIALVHLKEYARSARDLNPVVGCGSVGAAEITDFALREGHESIIIEFERVSDEESYIRESLKFVKERVYG